MEVPDGLAHEYGKAAQMLQTLHHLRRIWSALVPPPPMKRSDMMMIMAVTQMARKQGSPVTASTLAAAMHQSLPGVSQKLSWLEDQGLIVRVGDKADRRVSYIELTDKGREFEEHMQREFLCQVDQALQMLGDEKTDTLISLMNDMIGVLETLETE